MILTYCQALLTKIYSFFTLPSGRLGELLIREPRGFTTRPVAFMLNVANSAADVTAAKADNSYPIYELTANTLHTKTGSVWAAQPGTTLPDLVGLKLLAPEWMVCSPWNSRFYHYTAEVLTVR